MLPFMGSISFWLVLPIFFLGLCVGSFINVVVMRTLRDEDFMRGRSHCDSCGRTLAWYEMIPLLSYLVLGGKCRTCHNEIDIMHPIIEFITGALFAWWWLIGFAFFRLTSTPLLQILQPAFWLVVGIVLLIILIIDLRSYLIPDWTVSTLFWLTLAYRLFLTIAGIYRPQDFAWSMFGALILLLFFLALWLITKKRGFGFGDVKLIFPLALLMGWPKLWVGVWLAFVIGAAVGVSLIILGKKRFGQVLPFAPFLILGTILSLLYGQSLLSWYTALM
jgi:prepilin signal peptidase PulO-like enzyme (type II secretory pathway)